ncbi:MAG: hypothetical protein FVQ85_10050 [Planctomycetes bacterium]|nr:hypothetical protein [Planctomycetota bacterium]
MKTIKPAVILLALVLLIAAGAQSAEKSTAPKISNTRYASCLVKVTSDPSVMPLNDIIIEYLMHSSGVVRKAVREVLDISPEIPIPSRLVQIEEVFAGDSALGGIGIPLGTTVPGRRSPTTARTPTPSRTPTARTARPGSTGTPTTTRRPTTPSRTTRRTPTVTQPLPSAGEQTILFRLRVDLSISTDEPIKPAAEEFMFALIENLRSALRGAFDQYSAKLNKQLKLADEEADRAEHELVQMQRILRDISGSRDLSRYAILKNISSLRQILQSAKMKRASDEMLYEATAKRIAETKDKRKQRVDNDSITSELRSMLYVHEKGLQEAQKLYDAGDASLANIQDIKEKIVRAKIELAQRREQIINPAGGVEISSLNDELATLSIQTDLAHQEIHSFEKQLKEAENLLKNADTYELLSLKADIAKQNLEEALLWRARLGRNNRSIQPPDVTVIGAE